MVLYFHLLGVVEIYTDLVFVLSLDFRYTHRVVLLEV